MSLFALFRYGKVGFLGKPFSCNDLVAQASAGAREGGPVPASNHSRRIALIVKPHVPIAANQDMPKIWGFSDTSLASSTVLSS
jgi:hypothetical protein